MFKETRVCLYLYDRNNTSRTQPTTRGAWLYLHDRGLLWFEYPLIIYWCRIPSLGNLWKTSEQYIWLTRINYRFFTHNVFIRIRDSVISIIRLPVLEPALDNTRSFATNVVPCEVATNRRGTNCSTFSAVFGWKLRRLSFYLKLYFLKQFSDYRWAFLLSSFMI